MQHPPPASAPVQHRTKSPYITQHQSFGLTDNSKRSEFGQDIIDIIGRPRDRAEGPPGRVYFHRSGAAFARVAPGGLVLFQNVHWRDPSGVSLPVGHDHYRRRRFFFFFFLA